MRPGPWTAILAVACGIGGGPLHAQLAATTDLTLGAVRYEGFLGSGAVAVTPAVRYDRRTFSLAAQGSFLVYESGRTLVQGAAAAAWISPAVYGFRAEVSGFGGLSGYADAPAAGYGLARVRLHAMAPTRGVWMAAGVGEAYAGTTEEGTTEISAGAWMAFPGLVVTATAVNSAAADSGYTDLSASIRWLRGVLELDGLIGMRPRSATGDEGLFAEVLARVALTRRLAAQVSAGRYFADPIRGAVAGRYVSGGVRLTLAGGRPAARAADERLRSEVRLPVALPAGAPELQISETPLGMRTLRVRVESAERVEIAADFTDWQPVALRRAGRDAWQLPVHLPLGVYRLNVRVDGGPWRVPRGAAPLRDEFGGYVGIVVVR